MKSKIAMLIIGLVIGTMVYTVHADTATPPAPFDHSNCQYPDRTTNPPNGCDNSDPCDPAQTKGGSGDCLPTQPQPQVTQPVPTEPEPAAPAKQISQCGGK